jgi:hypothetical protein
MSNTVINDLFSFTPIVSAFRAAYLELFFTRQAQLLALAPVNYYIYFIPFKARRSGK